jgi:para-aminobenzoate synthetase component 1
MFTKIMPQPVQEQLNKWGTQKTPFVFLIDFECLKPICWSLKEPIKNFEFNFNGYTNIIPNRNAKQVFDKTFEIIKDPITFKEYQQKFDYVKNEIEYGNSFLVNLTTSTKIETNLSIDFIAHNSNSKYVCYLNNQFVSFSPETFIKIKNGKIFAYPMKGTIDGNIPNAEELILSDTKELAEHATIVDLIRNDLSKVSKNVRVTKYRYYEQIKTQQGIIGQVSSEIEGILPENYNELIGDIIFDLLPAGSVSGAPKNKTKEIIAMAEQVERGYYTGVAGYFDGTNLDSCVLIRYLQSDKIYRSGGGITAQSKALVEYEEMINKVYVPAF